MGNANRNKVPPSPQMFQRVILWVPITLAYLVGGMAVFVGISQKYGQAILYGTTLLAVAAICSWCLQRSITKLRLEQAIAGPRPWPGES